MRETVFLDSNVLIYAVGKDHDYREACRRILRAVAEGLLPAVTSTEVLQEVVYRFASVRSLEVGLQVAREALALVPVILPVEAADIARMVEIIETAPGLPPRDALHLAVASRAGVGHIVTADRHFTGRSEVAAVDPLELARRL